MTTAVITDERTVAVQNASFGWALIFLQYALLVDGMYRGFFLKQAAWDLLFLVIVSGAISIFYQYRQQALPDGLTKRMLPIVIASGVLGAILAAVLQLLGD